jgi:hypothetical protein
MQPTFRSSYFALLESYAPQLLAGPEARVPFAKMQKPGPGAVIVQGVLGPASDWFTDSSYDAIRQDVRRALADPQARTVDLYVDSPGGAVLGLPETADLIHRAAKQKPVRAFVTGIAASAAFWLASQASTVHLTPSGEVGSVGILDLSVDISKALESGGIKGNAVSSTPEKIERAPFTPLSDSARAHMQAGVDRWYQDFLGAIRRGRGARVSANSNFGSGRMLSWIFEGYAARGKITGLSGEPGEAKSLISLDWAARYTTGRGWPNGSLTLQPPGKVLVFATEDDAADTILPRFLSAGGDPQRLLRLRLDNDKGFYFDDPGHQDILRRVTEQHADIGMVIIDPILEHLRVNKEQTTREAYAPLRVLIAQRGIALIQIVHTNKRSADNVGSVGDKIGGVKALVGLPRFVYSVHKTEDDIRHLCRVKQNVGRAVKGSMDFRLLDKAGQPVIEWLGIGTATAQDALTVKNARPDCAARLLTLLQDGDNESDELRGTLMDEGFSLDQVKRAVGKLRLNGDLEVVKLANRKTVWRSKAKVQRASQSAD